MAVPRVFISSTCYDLSEVRDRLVSFCASFGFETVLSERGDVFYHPDLHTHDSCLNEISNCQIFILIIGGRFGGKHRVDPSKSITNAEFYAAKEIGLPVFTFVKEGVLNDHHTYQRNKDKVFVGDIVFPSIENQEFASKIFNFIDNVRLSETNNGFFGFLYAKEIETLLRKQLASMFFDFLVKRNISSQLAKTNEAVSSLAVASKKIEQLVKTIYREVDSAHADHVINEIDDLSEANEFFRIVSDQIDIPRFIPRGVESELRLWSDEDFVDFLLLIEGIDYVHNVCDEDGRTVDILGYNPSHKIIVDVSGDLNKFELKRFEAMENAFRAYLRLPTESRERVLSKYVIDINGGASTKASD